MLEKGPAALSGRLPGSGMAPRPLSFLTSGFLCAVVQSAFFLSTEAAAVRVDSCRFLEIPIASIAVHILCLLNHCTFTIIFECVFKYKSHYCADLKEIMLHFVLPCFTPE